MRVITRKIRKIPEILTAEERKTFFSQIDSNHLIGLRNLCMLKLMIDCGLRISEVIHLSVIDVDWNTGELIVRHGKGNSDRLLYLSDNNLDLLKQWKELRPVQSPLLFTTFHGTAVYDVYIRQVVKRITKRAGIEKNIHPHTLRHFFATDLYRQTKDIRLVQKALGHADISTTMIYTHIVDDDLKIALRSFRENEKEQINIKLAS